ncbi:hypothetical protein, variant [Cryptococcus amylolentus CBS 6039]|uniref:Uncharacterized protein n=1 Tax=Cryptococcus amylolentus CBS 6039 TaxID=1295533 RepID=A0A1E3HMB3_9TREE|nr:hypothetical protein, variant [Cryptococcus amylolentus CBS 6039]ODN77492.1 hypothetical protein, variant [Cryptococcus amylolentus CBS 6039]
MLFRLVEEFKLVDASYNLKSTPKEMVAYLEQALQYIYTDLNHSGLTHGGLPLLIYHSKTTYSNAIQKGGSILQPHYFEHDARSAGSDERVDRGEEGGSGEGCWECGV